MGVPLVGASCVKVAAIQFCPQPRDREGNLKRLVLLAVKAARNGAEVIVMPELALSGYSMMSVAEAEPMAEVITEPTTDPRPDSSMSTFSAIAREYGVHLAWGLVEKDYGTGNLYNTQVMVCPDASFESHRKVNFFGNDYLWATEGRSNPPIRKIQDRTGKSWKVGLLVCRDVRDKKDAAWKAFYEVGDADIVVLSANWGDGAFPATPWIEFATDNNSWLVVSNRYGKEAPNDFGEGGVCVVSPEGKVQCEGLQWSQDCIVYGEIG
jgi:predicted amidohydrolase